MELTSERRLPAPLAVVWRGLSDPETLRACLPGCRAIERLDANTYRATGSVDSGSVTAPLSGTLRIVESHPPVSCRVEGSGDGGAAGAKGGAIIALEEAGAFTLLRYSVNLTVDSLAVQPGAELTEASARRYADRFLDNFTASVAQPEPMAADGPAAMAAAPSRVRLPIPATMLGFPTLAWVAAAVFAFIVFNLFATS